MPNGNAQEILHYSDGTDSPAWSEQKVGSTVVSWTRNIEGIDGGLAAIYDSQAGGTISLQLTNLHGDIVATASNSSTASGLTNTFESDEFGNPRTTEPPLRLAWRQATQDQLASGVIQMGVRSYVPAMGRFTSVDPVAGGSSSDYDYSNADPINSLDLDGRTSKKVDIPCITKPGTPVQSRVGRRGWDASGSATVFCTHGPNQRPAGKGDVAVKVCLESRREPTDSWHSRRCNNPFRAIIMWNSSIGQTWTISTPCRANREWRLKATTRLWRNGKLVAKSTEYSFYADLSCEMRPT